MKEVKVKKPLQKHLIAVEDGTTDRKLYKDLD